MLHNEIWVRKKHFFPVNTILFFRAIFDFILETKFHAIVIENFSTS